MKTAYPVYWPLFYTATIFQWKALLSKNNYKDIIVESLLYLVNNKRILLNGFVIMRNHIHLIWQPLHQFTPSDIQSGFMKYTSQQIIRLIKAENLSMLTEFKVSKGDRDHQVWKREPLSVDLFTPEVFHQKLNYIHNNPVRAGVCKHPEEYYYSSAKFYRDGIDHFGMLTHYTG